jgi:hypothetical protein
MPKNPPLLAKLLWLQILAILKSTYGQKKPHEHVAILFSSAWRVITTRLYFTESLRASWFREGTQLVPAKAVPVFTVNLS